MSTPCIGKRAAEEIRRRAHEEDTTYLAQLRALNLAASCFRDWEHGSAPGGIHLARMAEAGYDVMYILTGRRTL